MRLPSAHRQHGFTLIETLVVVVIIALLAAVMAPNMISTPNTRLRADASELINALRETRLHAMRTRQPAVLQVNTRELFYRLPGKHKVQQLDDELTLQLTTAESELTGDEQGGIRFFADGSSTGGRITLSNGSLVQHVDVEWLTGKVRLLDGQP